MKILLTVIGKTMVSFVKEGIEEYVKRICRYVPFEMKVLSDVRTTKKLSEAAQKDAEGAMILNSLQPGDFVVLLDERGKEPTSREFARYLEGKMVTVPKQIVFVVGGPYGFSEAVYARANDKMSLSRLTFPHELVRLVFVEQLYRAFTIMRGEPYHHD